jgi:GNAT superfamily N-acetyltransferase
MQISCNDCVRMERAHVQAWPALRSATIDGWLWRSSGGGSQRANSVSTIEFHSSTPEASIAQAEFCYDAAGEPARFHTFDEMSSPGLADMLRKRGYRPGEPTTTMLKRIEAAGAAPDVEARDHAWTVWRDVYLDEITCEPACGQRTHSRPDTPATRLLRLSSRRRNRCPRAVRRQFRLRRDRMRGDAPRCARRQGAAQSVLAGLERWAVERAKERGQRSADWLGLQVATGNAPAVALYQRLGFVAGAVNSFWEKR